MSPLKPAQASPFGRAPSRPHPLTGSGENVSVRLIGIVALAIVLLAAPTAVNAGQVLAFSFKSQTLGRAWRYNAYLPDGYEHSNLRYPVLFMLHGYSENENAWVSKGRINAVADRLIGGDSMRGTVPSGSSLSTRNASARRS